MGPRINVTQPGAAFNDSSWLADLRGSVCQYGAGFAVTNYKASIASIGNLAQAQTVIDSPSNQTFAKSETAPVINYLNSGGAGEFTAIGLIRGLRLMSMRICCDQGYGFVHIPTAGLGRLA